MELWWWRQRQIRGRERKGLRVRSTGGAKNGLSAMAKKATREELGLELWLISFHGAKTKGNTRMMEIG